MSELSGMRPSMVTRHLKYVRLVATLALYSTAAACAQQGSAGSHSARYSQAENLVRTHQWDEGLTALQPLLKQFPRDARALNLAGLACTGKGDLKQANAYFRRALAIEPGFVPALKNLGINEFTLHESKSSEQHLSLALKRVPEDPVINLYLGEIAYSRQDFKTATERLKLAESFVARDGELRAHLAVSLLQTAQIDAGLTLLDSLTTGDLSPSSQFAIGVSLAQANLPARAVPYFALLRQRFPDSYNVAFNLLLCYIRAKQFPEAIELSSQLISSGHDTDEIENAVAEAYEQTHDTPRAVTALRRAIELNPKDEDNFIEFANLCIDHRDFENGLKVLDVGLKVQPSSYRLVFERGVLYAMEDRFDLAEQDFQLSSKLAPASNFGSVGMGVTYLETGNASKAIDLLHQRLKQNPKDASLLYLLGEALMRNGAKLGEPSYAEAQSAFEESVRLNSGLVLPHVALGEIYVDEERYKDAIKELEQARAIDPKEKSAYSHLAVAYRRLGNTEEAKRILGLLKDLHQQERGWTHEKMKPENDSSAASSQTGPE